MAVASLAQSKALRMFGRYIHILTAAPPRPPLFLGFEQWCNVAKIYVASLFGENVFQFLCPISSTTVMILISERVALLCSLIRVFEMEAAARDADINLQLNFYDITFPSSSSPIN